MSNELETCAIENYCGDCGKVGIDYRSKRCRSCAVRLVMKTRSPEVNEKIKQTLLRIGMRPPVTSLKGEKNPNWHKPMSEEQKQKIREKRKLQAPTFLGRQHSEVTKIKISRSRRGKYFGVENNKWKGGISSLAYQIRGCSQYKEWRTEVFKRDDYTCQNCDERGGDKHVHHLVAFSKIISQFKIKTFSDALQCSLLWDITNGMTLCIECHRQTF